MRAHGRWHMMPGLAGVVLMTLQSAAGQAPAFLPDYDHGIICFHSTPIPEPAALAGLRDPSVQGGELITWWADIERREGQYDWSVVERDLDVWHAAGKKLDIRLATAHTAPDTTPNWLHDRYGVRRIARGIFETFTQDTGAFACVEPGRLVPDTDGDAAGCVRARNTGPGTAVFLRTGPGVRLARGGTYCVQFDYRMRERGTVVVRAASPGEGTETVRQDVFSADAASAGTRVFTTTLGPSEDYRIEWLLEGPGSVEIDTVSIVRIELNPPFVETDLASGTGIWRLLPGARRSRDPEDRISGEWSVVCENARQGRVPLLENDPERFPIEEGAGYNLSFDFRARTAGTLFLRIATREAPEVVVFEKQLAVNPGEGGTFPGFIPHAVWRPDCVARIGLIGPGNVVIDRLRHMVWSERVPCFPDYFSPAFREKWARFVQAFADRFRDHPGLGIVSVGGFGRWEEVMLDEDRHGVLDPQWLAAGFTPERYLEHIEWCMDLYREALPGRPLRICLAYGLERRNDVAWVYRRVAQAAAARGIGLKQNGLSERYDTWNDNTDTSYLYTQYRHAEISLTHETGGQIYRNSAEATGHPVSLLNRALINRVDFLYLYGDDIRARHIRKYFPYAVGQMGRSLFTGFYCRLGEFPLVHEHRAAPVVTRNLWLGLRQWNAPGAEADYETIDGSPCAWTGGARNGIAFDVDDREQALGMHGVVLTFDFLDDAPGELRVTCADAAEGTWRELGRIRKTGVGTWRPASFAGSEWCRSPRASGEDEHVDVLLEHLGQGRTAVRRATLDFVPADEWQRRTVRTLPPADGMPPATADSVRDVRLGEGETATAVQVPLSAPTRETGRLTVRVARRVNGMDSEICRKEAYIPADNQWLELPFAPVVGPATLRIAVASREGNAALRAAEDGQPACQVTTFAEREETARTRRAGTTLAFAALRPFHALRLRGDAAVARLERILPDGTAAVVPVAAATGPEPGECTLHVEPQGPARYRLTFPEPGGPPAPESDVRLLCLVPLRIPRPAMPDRRGRPVAAWEGEAVARNWHPDGTVLATGPGEDGATLAIADEIRLVGPDGPGIETRGADRVEFTLRNETGSGLARILWAPPGQPFAEENSALIPVIPNDPEPREYAYPVGAEPGWKGTVGRLAIEPATGPGVCGRVTLARIAVTTPETLLDMAFRAVDDVLLPVRDATTERGDGVLGMAPTGPHPTLRVPDARLDFDGATGQVLELTFRNGIRARRGRIRWRTNGHPVAAHRALLEETALAALFVPEADPAGWQTCRIPIGDSPEWNGRIVLLAVEFEDAGEPAGTLDIRALRILAAPRD